MRERADIEPFEVTAIKREVRTRQADQDGTAFYPASSHRDLLLVYRAQSLCGRGITPNSNYTDLIEKVSRKIILPF
jgi:hypothetical protein